MRLALGIDVLTIELSTDPDNGTDPGDCTTTPLGFTPSHGDQRWNRGAELT